MKEIVGVLCVHILSAHEHEGLAVYLYLGSAVLCEHHVIANLYRHGDDVAVLVILARAYSDNNAALGLLLGIGSDVQAASGGLLSLVLTNKNAIAQWSQCHD